MTTAGLKHSAQRSGKRTAVKAVESRMKNKGDICGPLMPSKFSIFPRPTQPLVFVMVTCFLIKACMQRGEVG